MTEEFFDVVNEKDEVVGRELRSVVHARGLKHRAVHILIFNSKNQLFLQKRSMSKDVAPGCWDSSCCGHVDSGEGYEQAVVRELQEELGLTVSLQEVCKVAPLFKIEAREETGQEFVMVYRMADEGPFELHPVEIERGEWFTAVDIDRLVQQRPSDFAESFRYIWEQYKKLENRTARFDL